ncbi:hypothetical protein C0991_008745 [Blastosporella zonata]|nr:hypothetical protein C0991_008745 [Blastosporella zonata]
MGARGTLTKDAELAVRDTDELEDAATTEDEEDEEIEDIPDGDLSVIQAGPSEPCKLVLVVRTDLKMTSGKIAAHQAKIALKGTSEEQMLELEAIAKSLNLCARSIQDQ